MFTHLSVQDHTQKKATKKKPKIKPASVKDQEGAGLNLQRYLGSQRVAKIATNQEVNIQENDLRESFDPGSKPMMVNTFENQTASARTPAGTVYPVRPPLGQTSAPTYPTPDSPSLVPVPADPTSVSYGPTTVPTDPASEPASSMDITSETVALSPADRTRTTIGVGEEVNLTHKRKHVKWTTTDGILSGAIDNKVKFIAPDRPKKITITGNRSSITFDVIAPNGVFMELMPFTGVFHTQGRPDSGINLKVYLKPDTVNFYKVRVQEVNVGAVADGIYSPFQGQPHVRRPDPLPMTDTVVSHQGTLGDGGDCVYSGDPGGAPPFAKGSIRYEIPYEYQILGGTFYPFAKVQQESTFDPDGEKLKSSKANAWGETTLMASTVYNLKCTDNM